MAKEWQELQFIRSDGVVYNLHSPPSRAVLNMSGWGKPVNNFHTTSGPYQHGETPISYRLSPRTISLELVHTFQSRSQWYNGRSSMLAQMGVNNASPNLPLPGVLRWHYIINGVYTIRDLDIFTVSGLGFTPLEGWREWSVLESMEFIAHNPIIYDPTVHTSAVSTFYDSLIFPMNFPFVLGTSYGIMDVTYGGTWEEYPTITVTGPAAGVYIENYTTGKKLRLNYTVSLNETITFDLKYNTKTITSDSGQDLSQYLSDDSDLGEFNLQYDPIVPDGINTIIVYTIGATTGTTFTFTYYNRYYGI